MKKLVIIFGLISLLPSFSSAGPLDAFAGAYTLGQGTEGINDRGDLICPDPLIFRLTLSSLDSNMPQLPVLQVAQLKQGDTQYTGEVTADGSAFTYKQTTKSGCFLGFFAIPTASKDLSSW